jgi:hypothetical protein
MKVTYLGRTGTARSIFMNSVIIINWDGGGYQVFDTLYGNGWTIRF